MAWHNVSPFCYEESDPEKFNFVWREMAAEIRRHETIGRGFAHCLVDSLQTHHSLATVESDGFDTIVEESLIMGPSNNRYGVAIFYASAKPQPDDSAFFQRLMKAKNKGEAAYAVDRVRALRGIIK
ncbi:MAG: hypothetical protein KKD18_03885 [Nanoarchaeota archaeon]|nr:hypothetical protein [Nanoarchaeota archaeon]MBU0977532.1 hypothetical protein [Nanoarchaeota archaeon]